MPKMGTENMVSMGIGGSAFKFSAVNIDALSEIKYTNVVICIDISGSVGGFASELLECLKSIVLACQKSSMKDFILIRLVVFNDNLSEIHGFIPVSSIDANSYKSFSPYGSTALFDAAYSAVGSILEYSKQLDNQGDITSNGIAFFITDGCDNASTMGANEVGTLLKEAIRSEALESLLTFLIGIDVQSCKPELDRFFKIAGLTEFIDAGSATPDVLARIAKFVSSSVSSQSQALQSGGPSQVLTF